MLRKLKFDGLIDGRVFVGLPEDDTMRIMDPNNSLFVVNQGITQ
jgi:hypothetical protein